MIFADLFFLYIFIPAVAVCYALARCGDLAIAANRKGSHFAVSECANNHPLQNAVLVIFSLIFYAWGEPIYVLLMGISVFLNYIIGLLMDRFTEYKKLLLIIGLVIDIGIIAVFKYTDFLIETINLTGLDIPLPKIALPIGISFFTFQTISYIIDVYRGSSEVQKSYLNLLLYISMFPQLIAGPIVRYETIAREINCRSISFDDIAEGSFRFLIGLGKKVILANQLSEISSRFLDGNFDTLTAGGAWLGIIAFSLQIYFDFSGYSDMAIGMGRCFGFHFDENFNYPYISKTITEFWRRWHISLGSFFRDYVYIPLGGNRRHQPLNIMMVWFLTGLWHGASWNFVLWGVYFGIIIMIEKYTVIKIQDKIPAVFLHLYSLFIIVLGWVLFYFTDFGKIGQVLAIMFGGGSAGGWDLKAQNTLTGNLWLILVCVIACIPFSRLVKSLWKEATGYQRSGFTAAVMTFGKIVCAAAILIASTLLLIGDTSNPFLYLRF